MATKSRLTLRQLITLQVMLTQSIKADERLASTAGTEDLQRVFAAGIDTKMATADALQAEIEQRVEDIGRGK